MWSIDWLGHSKLPAQNLFGNWTAFMQWMDLGLCTGDGYKNRSTRELVAPKTLFWVSWSVKLKLVQNSKLLAQIKKLIYLGTIGLLHVLNWIPSFVQEMRARTGPQESWFHPKFSSWVSSSVKHDLVQHFKLPAQNLKAKLVYEQFIGLRACAWMDLELCTVDGCKNWPAREVVPPKISSWVSWFVKHRLVQHPNCCLKILRTKPNVFVSNILLDNSYPSIVASVHEYCKKTFTGLLTNYFSFAPLNCKLGLVRTLPDRVYKGCRTLADFLSYSCKFFVGVKSG